MRSEAYAQYRPAQREPSIPKECQICLDRIKPGQEIIARLDGTRWSAKHRSCDEMQHAVSVISPVPRPVMVDRDTQVDLGDELRSTSSERVPELFADVPSEEPSPMQKIANGLREVASGVINAVTTNPGRVLLAGLAIAAVIGYRAYSVQEHELYCVKDLIDEQVAYCAKIPTGLTSEQRAGVIYTKHLMEGQYYPAPGGQTHSYSEIAGGEEFTSLSWTS